MRDSERERERGERVVRESEREREERVVRDSERERERGESSEGQ